MNNNEPPKVPETPKVSNTIAILSVLGLTASFIYSTHENASVPLVLYAIFGAGILGAPTFIEILKAIFRIDK